MTKATWTAGIGLLALAAGLCLGCSGGRKEEPKLNVKGKVTSAGQTILLDEKLAAAKAARLQLRFLRVDEKSGANFSETAFAEPDGTFKARLPKGKYRIAVGYYPDGREDKLGGKFDERNSKILRDVTTEGQGIDLDVSKPEG